MNLSLSEMSFPFRLRPAIALSEEKLLRFCSDNDFLRVEREPTGELLIMTPSGSETGRQNVRIGRFLDEWAELDGRGIAFDSSAGFSLQDGSMRAPDAAWVRRERWQALTRKQQKGFAPVAPDFVVELRADTDRLPALKRKMELWVVNGVSLGWLIDPQKRTVHVYRAGDAPEVLNDPSSVQGTGVMAGFELVLERVWGKGT